MSEFWGQFHPPAPTNAFRKAANLAVLVVCFPFFFLANAVISLGEP